MILVTNDDGVDSEGLLALKQALERVDSVVVIAPNRNWTAAGHTRTLDRPLRVVEITLAEFYIGGDVPSGMTDEVGTDIWAVTNNCVSITPILMDLTNHGLLEKVKGWDLRA